MTCIGPMPAHLRHYDWYASHQAWLRDRGQRHHDPEGAEPERASVAGSTLDGAYLYSAVLDGADLTGARLTGAVLTYALLRDADLTGADLTGADLNAARLTYADLTDADLTGARLNSAVLTAANLTGASLPDGRSLEQWRLDPLAGLCTDPESVARAATAWGNRSWRDCPLHEGMGISGLRDIEDADTRRLAAIFVALLDGGHLPQPPETP